MSEQVEPRIKEKMTWRLSHVIFIAICVCAALALAAWQWMRFQSGSGTFQNLGYALQWPFLGGFLIYAYRKYLQYENEAIDLENEEAEMMAAYTAGDADPTAAPRIEQRPRHEEGLVTLSNRPSLVDHNEELTEIDESFLPERPSIDVEEFNRLNDPHRRRRRG